MRSVTMFSTVIWLMACNPVDAPVIATEEASTVCSGQEDHLASGCASGILCGGPGFFPCPEFSCWKGICEPVPIPTCHFASTIDTVDHDDRMGTCELKAPKPAILPLVLPIGPLDLNFLVASDLHVGKHTDDEMRVSQVAHHTGAMNSLSRIIVPHLDSDAAQWPPYVRGHGALGDPIAVVATGDMTASGYKEDLGTFRAYYERELYGSTFPDELRLPLFPGLGNHDTDTGPYAESYMTERIYRNGITSFDYTGVPGASGSLDYSWDWYGVHFIQLNTWAGDTDGGRTSGLAWLRSDLSLHASAGQPVVLFQHFGFDDFGYTFDKGSYEFWSPTDSDTFYSVVAPYNIMGIFVGHTHVPAIGQWHGIDVYQGSTGGIDNQLAGFFATHLTAEALDVTYLGWDALNGDLLFDAPSLTHTKGQISTGGKCLQLDATGPSLQPCAMSAKQFLSLRDGMVQAGGLCLTTGSPATVVACPIAPATNTDQLWTTKNGTSLVDHAGKCLKADPTNPLGLLTDTCDTASPWSFGGGGPGQVPTTGAVTGYGGKCLDVAADGTLIMKTCNGTTTQGWQLVEHKQYVEKRDDAHARMQFSDGSVELASAAFPGKCMVFAAPLTPMKLGDCLPTDSASMWHTGARGELRMSAFCAAVPAVGTGYPDGVAVTMIPCQQGAPPATQRWTMPTVMP